MKKSNLIHLRVRYAETDQMGFVYYGNYAQYFEVARVELLRTVGISYKSLEEEGIILPVLEYNIKYILPAHYDNMITVHTSIEKIEGTRIHFAYETYNEAGKLLNKAHTSLVFVNQQTRRPVSCPAQVIQALETHQYINRG